MMCPSCNNSKDFKLDENGNYICLHCGAIIEVEIIGRR